MSRRAVERAARQRFILDAARALFEEKGVEHTSMDDIAASAEYTRRTLYTYFASRDDICLRVHVEDMARRWELQKHVLEGVEGAPTRIEVWAQTLYAYWKGNPHSMRMEQYWDFHGIEPDRIGVDVFARFQALNEELADELRRIFRDGVREGSLRPDLPVDVSISQFLYSLRAVLARALSSSYSFAEIDPDEYVRLFLELYCRGIRNENEGQES